VYFLLWMRLFQVLLDDFLEFFKPAFELDIVHYQLVLLVKVETTFERPLTRLVLVWIEADEDDRALSTVFPELDHTDLIARLLTVVLVLIALDDDNVREAVVEPVWHLLRATSTHRDIVLEKVFAKGFHKSLVDVMLLALEPSRNLAKVWIGVVEAVRAHLDIVRTVEASRWVGFLANST
jgi:hypothetical protein